MTFDNWNQRRSRKARDLLRPALPDAAAGTWADVGCGDGIFTELLAEWLEPGSTIYAVDRDAHALRQLQRRVGNGGHPVRVETVCADFTQPLALPRLDGMVLANSLHFVRRKQPVLAALTEPMAPGAPIIIIEYNARRGNSAVPHPLGAEGWMALMDAANLQRVHVVGRAPSSFLGEMVAVVGRKRGRE